MRPARHVQEKNTAKFQLGDALFPKHGSANPTEPQASTSPHREDPCSAVTTPYVHPGLPHLPEGPVSLSFCCGHSLWSLTGSSTAPFCISTVAPSAWLCPAWLGLPGGCISGRDLHNKGPQTRWLKQQECTVSQFWRLDVGRAGSFWGL